MSRRDLPVVPPGSCAEGPFALTLNGSRLTPAHIRNWLPRSEYLASTSVVPRSRNSRRTRDSPSRTDNRSAAVDPSWVHGTHIYTHAHTHRPPQSDHNDLIDPAISEGEPCRDEGATNRGTKTDVRGASSSSYSRLRAPAAFLASAVRLADRGLKRDYSTTSARSPRQDRPWSEATGRGSRRA